MRPYVKIARLDHWIKQFFIVPGIVIALFMTRGLNDLSLPGIAGRCIIGFFATCCIASANYVINEWLDAKFDKYHPTKKNRPVVTENLNKKIVVMEYVGLSIVGFQLAFFVSKAFLAVAVWLWVMGILYNVEPIRTKDVAYLDVLSESVNNAIRLLLGWFIVTNDFWPPVSIVVGYWMAGAFLMAVKRFAEFRMIGDADVAAHYRKSFRHYTEKSLLISSLFYAMLSIFLCGTFMVKYRVELILAVPLFCSIFCYYLYLAFEPDSVVQKPEKLYKEKKLLVLCLCFVALFCFLMFFDIPVLGTLLSNELIALP